MLIPDFDAIAFRNGARFEGLWDRVWTTRIQRLGTINFPSGRIIVADSLCTTFTPHPTLEREVPNTVAQCNVSYATSKTPDGQPDEVILAAWVRFGDSEIVHWAPAYYEDFEPDDTYHPGFGVDSGTACIADADAARSVDSEDDGEALLRAINEPVADFAFHPRASEHFVAVRSGLGDGFYSSFWGLDAGGTVVCLVVDFELMHRPIWDVATIGLPLRRGELRHEVFDRAGAKVWVPRLPLFSSPRLRIRGGLPRVRVLDGDEVAGSPSAPSSDPIRCTNYGRSTERISRSRSREGASPWCPCESGL